MDDLLTRLKNRMVEWQTKQPQLFVITRLRSMRFDYEDSTIHAHADTPEQFDELFMQTLELFEKLANFKCGDEHFLWLLKHKHLDIRVGCSCKSGANGGCWVRAIDCY